MKNTKKPSSPANKEESAKPMKKDEVQKNPDEHIDQDFPGYPHPPSQEKTINPVTAEEKANARLIKKERYNQNDTDQQSDGSANAFDRTEDDVLRGELEDDDDNKSDNY